MSLLAEETIAGPGGPLPRSLPLSPPPESRSPAKPGDPGARRRAGQVPAPARPPARRRLGFGESRRRERAVRCRVLVHPKPALAGPLGLAAGSVGKVQLVVGFGGVGSGAGGNKQLELFFPQKKGRITCVIGRGCMGGPSCSFWRSRLSLGSSLPSSLYVRHWAPVVIDFSFRRVASTVRILCLVGGLTRPQPPHST